MKSSQVIWNINCYSGTSNNRKDVDRVEWHRNGGGIKYIARKSALLLTNASNDKLVEIFNKSTLSYENFFKSLTKWNENDKKFIYELNTFGKIVPISLKNAKHKSKKIQNNQNVWETYLSFGSLTKERKIFSEFEYLDLLEKTLPNFFENEKLELYNLTTQIAIHSNTNNPHAHIHFFEKTPRFINSRTGKPTFRFKRNLNIKNLEKIRYKIKMLMLNKNREDVYDNKKDVWESRKIVRQILKQDFSIKTDKTNDKNHWISIVGNELFQQKNGIYSTLSRESKEAIWNIFQVILKENSYLKEVYQTYQNNISNLKELLKNSDIPEDKNQFKNFIKQEQETMEKQIGNVISKTIYYEIKNLDYVDFQSNNNIVNFEINEKIWTKLFWAIMKIPKPEKIDKYKYERQWAIFDKKY